MSLFFDVDPDLKDTVLKLEQLNAARDFYRSLFMRLYGDQPFRPGPAFGKLWNKQQYAPGYIQLALISFILKILYKNSRVEDQPIIDEKVRKFLNRKDDRQFEEDLNEFRIGAHFGLKLRPIAIEPLAKPDGKGGTTSSPDFSIIAEGQTVYIDSTTLRVGPIQDWSFAVDTLQQRLQHFLEKRNVSRRITLFPPLNFNIHDLHGTDWKKLCELVATEPSGWISLHKGSSTLYLRIEWEPFELRADGMLHFQHSGVDLHVVARTRPGGPIEWGMQIDRVPPIESTWTDLLHNSLTNAISNKKSQLSQRGGPAVLGITLGFKVYNSDHLLKLAMEFFRPGKHSWLAGLAIVLPATSHNKEDVPDRIIGVWNPHCLEPVPESVRTAIGWIDLEAKQPLETPPAAL